MIQQSICFKYEPTWEPLHISAKWWYLAGRAVPVLAEPRARPMRTLLLRQIVHLPEVRIKVTSVRNSYESHYETRARPVRTLLLRQVVHLKIRMKVTKKIRMKVTSQTGSY